jgi:hypothetical protein
VEVTGGGAWMGRGAKEVSPDAGEGPDPEAAARGEGGRW